jgi:hypothetical protein
MNATEAIDRGAQARRTAQLSTNADPGQFA